MAQTTDTLSDTNDDAETRRQAFLARLGRSEYDGTEGGGSVLDEASPAPGGIGDGSVLDAASPSNTEPRPSILEQVEQGPGQPDPETRRENLRQTATRGFDVQAELARINAENAAAQQAQRPGARQYEPDFTQPEKAGEAPPPSNPLANVPILGGIDRGISAVGSFITGSANPYDENPQPRRGDSPLENIPPFVPIGPTAGLVGAGVRGALGNIGEAIGARFGRAAPALENAASQVGRTVGPAGENSFRLISPVAEEAESGIARAIRQRSINAGLREAQALPRSAAQIEAGFFPSELPIGQVVGGNLPGALKAAAGVGLVGAGVGASRGIFGSGQAGEPQAPEEPPQEEQPNPGPGPVPQPLPSTQPGNTTPTPPPPSGAPIPGGAPPPRDIPLPGGGTPPPGAPPPGGAQLPPVIPLKPPPGGGTPPATGAKPGTPPVGTPPTGSVRPIEAVGARPGTPPPGVRPPGMAPGVTPGQSPLGPTVGPLPQAPVTADGLRQQVTADLNGIAQQLNAGPQTPDVMALFVSQGSKLLDLINQQEASLRSQSEKDGSQIDPATQNTLNTLREMLDKQLKATRETMNSRGLLDSGILIEAEQMLRKGNLSDSAKILAERLSRIQDNLNQGLTQLRGQRVSTAQTFGLAGAQAQTQAEEAERNRMSSLRSTLVNGRLGLSGQVGQEEQQVAGRDFTAKQNELERQSAFARMNAELAARSGDAASQRQWQSREAELNRQSQAAIAAGNQQSQAARDAASQQAAQARQQPTAAAIDLATNNVMAQLSGLPYDQAIQAIRDSQGQPGFEQVDWFKVSNSLKQPSSGFKFPWQQ